MAFVIGRGDGQARSAPLPTPSEVTAMRLVRILIYVLATLAGLYLLAAVLYTIPVFSGALDDTMEAGLPQRADVRAEGNLLPPLARPGSEGVRPLAA